MTAWTIAAATLLLGMGAQDGARTAGGATDGMATGAKAMPAAPACPATPPPEPAGFTGWTAPTPLVAGRDAASAPALPVDTAARVSLGDAGAVRYAAAPGHAPAAGSHGGILALTVASAGRYRIALGAGAWIDLVGGTTPLPSVAHGHGPACSTLRKTVDFDLQPGRYLLQLSGNAAPTLTVMAVRLG